MWYVVKKTLISFIYNALHHPNDLISLLLHVILASANTVLAEPFHYLSFIYQNAREDSL